MTSRTVTTVVEAPRDDVFDYLANVENLPDWATEFARELRRDGETWKVVNGLGEFGIEYRVDRDTGVIDMVVEGAVFPTRVVGLDDERTAFTFTMFRWPGQPAELFESQYASLRREFANIERRFA